MQPENFLLMSEASDAQLKATDFGLSTFFREGQKFKEIVGSALYVAPEVRGKGLATRGSSSLDVRVLCDWLLVASAPCRT